jgi:hypothetical protein
MLPLPSVPQVREKPGGGRRARERLREGAWALGAASRCRLAAARADPGRLASCELAAPAHARAPKSQSSRRGGSEASSRVLSSFRSLGAEGDAGWGSQGLQDRGRATQGPRCRARRARSCGCRCLPGRLHSAIALCTLYCKPPRPPPHTPVREAVLVAVRHRRAELPEKVARLGLGKVQPAALERRLPARRDEVGQRAAWRGRGRGCAGASDGRGSTLSAVSQQARGERAAAARSGGCRRCRSIHPLPREPRFTLFPQSTPKTLTRGVVLHQRHVAAREDQLPQRHDVGVALAKARLQLDLALRGSNEQGRRGVGAAAGRAGVARQPPGSCATPRALQITRRRWRRCCCCRPRMAARRRMQTESAPCRPHHEQRHRNLGQRALHELHGHKVARRHAAAQVRHAAAALAQQLQHVEHAVDAEVGQRLACAGARERGREGWRPRGLSR